MEEETGEGYQADFGAPIATLVRLLRAAWTGSPRWQTPTLSASSGFIVAYKATTIDETQEKHWVPLPVPSQFAFGGDADCKLSYVQKSQRETTKFCFMFLKTT